MKERHWFRQSIPVKCTICKSRKQKGGKVIDAVSLKREDIKQYLKQHCRGLNHLKAAARAAAGQVGSQPGPAPEPDVYVPCRGLCFSDPSSGALCDFEHHFKQWLSWKSQGSEFQKHTYKFDAGKKTWEVKHSDCLEKCKAIGGTRPVCQTCMKLTHKDSLRQQLVTCAIKKFGAELLHARLFKSDQEIKLLQDAMKADVVYHRHAEKADKIINYKDAELQQWVQYSFTSVRLDHRPPALNSFIELVVTPAITMNVVSAKKGKPELLQTQILFEQYLQNPQNSDADKLDIAIAKAGVQGRLRGDPTLMGMILTCLKVIDRKEAGQSTHGPVSSSSGLGTDFAVDLASEAGMVLAASGGNSHFLSRFGVSKKHMQMDDFGKRFLRSNLGVPFLALSNGETIMKNMRLIDQKFSSFTNTDGRGLHDLDSNHIQPWY